jgi:hypothetical protein
MNQGVCNSLICKEIFNCVQWNGLSPISPVSLSSGYRARVDKYVKDGCTSFEIDVYNSAGSEVVMGPDGWLNKHGIKGNAVAVSSTVDNALRGLSILQARAIGMIPEKGALNIKGLNVSQIAKKWMAMKCKR